jgi:hypothetical protein
LQSKNINREKKEPRYVPSDSHYWNFWRVNFDALRRFPRRQRDMDLNPAPAIEYLPTDTHDRA